MNFPKGFNKLSAKVARLGLVCEKYLPEGLMVGGLILLTGSVILASKVEEERKDSLELHRALIKDIKEQSKNTGVAVNKKQESKEITEVFIETAKDMAGIYAPAIGTYILGVGCIATGFGIMKRRNLALMAAYAGLEKAFDKYRDRVRFLVGEDTEDDLYNGRKVVMDVYDENGTKTEVKILEAEDISGAVDSALMPYQVYWERKTSASYREDKDYAYTFLHGIERNMNEKLLTNGHLVLNDVYDALGLDHTPTGAICGWIIDESYPSETDWERVVQFKIVEEYYTDWDSEGSGIRTGRNPVSYRIDFNCDGIIWDRIGKSDGV